MHRCLGDAVHVDQFGACVVVRIDPGEQISKTQVLPAEDHVAQEESGVGVGVRVAQNPKC